MSVISVENLTHTYSIGTPFERTAISDICVNIRQGERVCILGHTGSGKTTFVQHLNALLQPSSGRVLVDGEDINRDKISRRDIKFKIGLVFQYPEYQLFEETVAEDIAFGPKNMKLPKGEIEERVIEAAGFAGVDEELFGRSPLDLSGGQKRRIAIAGVIAMRPEVLILDEPTAGLDPRGREDVFGMIRSYREATQAAVIIVTHSMEDAAMLADRILVMNRGKLALNGTVSEIFRHAEELEAMGLNIPASTKLIADLRRAGCDLSPDVYTAQAAADEIEAYLRRKTV